MELKKFCDSIFKDLKFNLHFSKRVSKNKPSNDCVFVLNEKMEDLLEFELLDGKIEINSSIGKYNTEASYFMRSNKEITKEKFVDFLKLIELIEYEVPVYKFYLNKLEIDNYRKYSKQKFHFESMFTLIVGENATGKTTILEGIATSLGGFLQGSSKIKSSETHSINARDMKREDIIENTGIRRIIHENTKVKGNYTINNFTLSWNRYLKNIKGRTNISKIEDFGLFSIVESLTKTNPKLILPLFSYHGTGRVWEQDNKNTSKMENLTRIDGYKGALNSSSNYKNFLSWFEKLERHSFNMREENKLLESVKSAIKKVLEKLTEETIKNISYRENDLEIYYENNNIARIGLMSDGYRNIIGIISDIAYRMTILNPNLEEPIKNTSGVVLIDEIDLHLHPTWQKKIVEILRETFPKIQFIATSHSPFIAQSMKTDEIIKLDSELEEKNSQDKISQEIKPIMTNGTKMSVEDVAERIMGVEDPQMSEKKKEMLERAREYYELLDTMEGSNDDKEIKKLRDRLDEISMLYEEDTAYSAFLERKRMMAEIKMEKKDETSK